MTDLSHDRDFAEALARTVRPSAPPALRNQLRASLLAAPVVFTPRRPALLAWLRPALAGLLVAALLISGGGYAAASSLPGEPAFALKRAVEDVQVAIAADDETRLDTLVTQADRRLADVETVTATRPNAVATATNEYLGSVARLDAALTTVAARPESAARDAVLARAIAESATHIAALQSLATRLPAQAQPGIQRAIEAQQAVHGKSGNAPGRRTNPGNGGNAPGRPSELPVTPVTPITPGGPPPGRGVPPAYVPGRP
ncbi:MAG: hypothetical protein NVSMB8_02330 [Candidatus Limnocylindrales bacterium]